MIIEIKLRKMYILAFLIISLVGVVIAYGTNNPGVLGNTGTEVQVTLNNGSNLNLQEWVDRNSVSSKIPKGMIAFFNLANCPVGWGNVTTSGANGPNIGAGRYFVALPSGGTRFGTVGTALRNLEKRNNVSNHKEEHLIAPEGLGTDGVSKLFLNFTLTNVQRGSQAGIVGNVIITPNASLYTAPYIQLLPCMKK